MTSSKHTLNACLYIGVIVLFLCSGCVSSSFDEKEKPMAIESLDLDMPAYFGPFFF